MTPFAVAGIQMYVGMTDNTAAIRSRLDVMMHLYPWVQMVVLRRAQDTLGSDPAGALALCGAHAQHFPRSSFAQEREVIAIDALVREN